MNLGFPKPRAFFFHYNKPASRAAGAPVISLHVGGACHLVRNVDCLVPVKGRIRKAQPRWVMTGRAHIFRADEVSGTVTIL
jgi:hypothetical protein